MINTPIVLTCTPIKSAAGICAARTSTSAGTITTASGAGATGTGLLPLAMSGILIIVWALANGSGYH